ncbi:MAG: hypothetical protein MUF53_12055, partial [Gemmatimonadaceae bacterium]|nr:hypothetical protein [Gemmatimonadaceae bacterium]
MFLLAVAAGALLAAPPPSPRATPADSAPTPGRFVARILDRDDGLPDLNVMAVARTRDGFLWVGTREGVVSYDGVRFAALRPDDMAQLPDRWVNGLTVDARDRLWIATAAGLAVREGGRVRRVAPDQIPATDVWRAITDRQGRVWVATARGVYRGDGTTFRLHPGVTGFAYQLLEDARGRIWVAGRELLMMIDGDRVVDVRAALQLRGRVYDIIADGPAHVWIALPGGARRLALGTGDAVQLDRTIDTRQGTGDRAVWVLGRDADGALLLGSSVDGLLRHVDGRLEALSPRPHETWALLRDDFGVLWAGTDQGLARFERGTFELVRRGLPPHGVWSLRRDASGTTWAGLSDGSVYRLAGDRFEPVVAGQRQTFLSPATWPTADGLLVAQAGRPPVRVTRAGGRTALPAWSRPVGDVLGLLEDSRGRLWISSDSGLFQQTGTGRLHVADTAVGLPRGARPRAMAEGPDGTLWFGRPWLTRVTTRGVRRLGRPEGLADSVVRVIVPQADVTWLGTADSGLYAVLDDRVVSLRHLHRVLADEVLGITTDAEGFLWVIGAYEVARLERRALLDAARGARGSVPVRTFDATDGLPPAPFLGDFQSVIVTDDLGRLLLPNADGMVRVDPRHLRRQAEPPPVLLTGVSANGREVRLDSSLTLPAGLARLEFSLAAPASARPRRVRLQVRLLGADSIWRDLGTQRDVSFGPLAGGDFTFEARAAAEDGPWSAQTLRVQVRVARGLVEQRWFVPLLLVVTAGLVLAIARGRQRLLERELARRQALEAALVRAQKLEGLGRLAGGVA